MNALKPPFFPVALFGGCDVYAAKLAYTDVVKRLQIYLNEELDEALAVRARREHRSKASLIRESLAEYIGQEREERDPFADWIGGSDAEPADIDEVVYGA